MVKHTAKKKAPTVFDHPTHHIAASHCKARKAIRTDPSGYERRPVIKRMRPTRKHERL